MRRVVNLAAPYLRAVDGRRTNELPDGCCQSQFDLSLRTHQVLNLAVANVCKRDDVTSDSYFNLDQIRSLGSNSKSELYVNIVSAC